MCVFSTGLHLCRSVALCPLCACFFQHCVCVCACSLFLCVFVCVPPHNTPFLAALLGSWYANFLGCCLATSKLPQINSQGRRPCLCLMSTTPLYQSQRLQSPTPALSLCQPYYIVLIDIVGTGQPALGQLWCRGPQVTHHCSFADFKTRSEV